jgi:hypothetical protein
MNISKFENYNKYFQKIFLALVLFSLTLVPWIEFINTNLNELDFIFTNNLFILLALYSVFIFFTYLILSYFISLTKYSLISFISISIWILFQHNFLKSNINIFLKNKDISIQYSSEIALIFILFLVYLFLFLIKRKKVFSNFFLFFLTFNLFFSILQFTNEIYSKKKNIDVSKQNNDHVISNIKRSNIYYFILDGMMPLNEFENYYKKDLSNFKNFYDQKKYRYFKDTLNLYPDTAATLTSLFYLEEIFINYENNKKNEYKPNIYRTFPGLLKKQYNPVLISELNKLGYQFKWIGNSFADCSKYNYKYCLNNKKEEYIDLYLLQAFLKKTPLIQIFNKLTEPDIVQKYLQINQRGNAIGKLKKFLVSNKNYIKKNSTFYFVHHMHPHWPYTHDEYCKYKKFPGNTNFEGYKNSYLCVVKKITDMIKIIDEIDEDAMVIFQSDHSWEMSLISEKKYGSRRQIFNLVKSNIKCDKAITNGLNNIQIMNYLINCLKNN